jgi:hypothetical protein
MYILIWFILTGAHLAPVIFLGTLEIWTAQAVWCKAGAMLIVCRNITRSPKFEHKSSGSRALGMFFIAVTALTIFHAVYSLAGFDRHIEGLLETFTSVAVRIQDIDVGQIRITFNKGAVLAMERFIKALRHVNAWISVAAIVAVIRAVWSNLTVRQVVRLMDVLRILVLMQCLLCVLQYFDLDQFWVNKYLGRHPEANIQNNPVFGFIGNSTHFSGYLAMMSPLFMTKFSRENVLALCLVVVILCFFTGTTLWDPSVMGLFVFPACLLWVLRFTNVRAFAVVAGILAVIVVAGLIFLPEAAVSRLFADNGRLGLWQYYWPKLGRFAVGGSGPGIIQHYSILAPSEGLRAAKHLHLEYYQIWFELGIFGLLFVLAGIKETLTAGTKHLRREAVILQAVCLGYFLTAFFNYSFHIWQMSICAAFAYAGFWKLTEDAHKQRCQNAV